MTHDSEAGQHHGDTSKRLLSSEDEEVLNFINTPRITRSFSYNLYSTKKTAALVVFDLTLLAANASQLKHVWMSTSHSFYHTTMFLLVIAVLLELLIGFGLLWLASMKIAEPEELEKAEQMNEEYRDAIIEAERAHKKAKQAGEAEGGDATSKKPTKRAAKVLLDTFKKSPYSHVNMLNQNRRSNLLNNLVVCLIFIAAVMNLFITAFGMGDSPYVAKQSAGHEH